MHPKHTRKPDKSVTGSRLTPVWPSFSWPYLLWAWDCSMIATTSDIRTLEFLDQYPLIKYSPIVRDACPKYYGSFELQWGKASHQGTESVDERN